MGKSFTRRLYDDIKNRIFANPKSTIASIVAAIAYLASMYGFEVSPEILAAISTVLLVLIGLFTKD